MLKFSKKTDYGLIALRHMTARPGESITSAREVSDTYGVSYELISKILQTLKRTGVVASVQGASGGYRLSRPLSTLSLFDFIEMLEGPQGVIDCARAGSEPCLVSSSCNVVMPMRELNRKVMKLLQETTLEDLFREAGPLPAHFLAHPAVEPVVPEAAAK